MKYDPHFVLIRDKTTQVITLVGHFASPENANWWIQARDWPDNLDVSLVRTTPHASYHEVPQRPFPRRSKEELEAAFYKGRNRPKEV